LHRDFLLGRHDFGLPSTLISEGQVSQVILAQGARTPVVLPITSGGIFSRTAGFAVSLTGSGTQTTGIVRCDQPRALDMDSRHSRKLETVPQSVIEEVLAKVAPIFE
jgi:mRNA-degrading endonuclease toxin of MazEF toxin-antitoxin module